MERLRPVPEMRDEVPELSAGLDYYKLTMSQLFYEQESDVIATATYHNRGANRILDYVDPTELGERFQQIIDNGWTAGELQYFGGLTLSSGKPVLKPGYLNYLQTTKLPMPEISYDKAHDDITIQVTGELPVQSLWETVVMSEVSEMHFRNYVKTHDLNLDEVYAEGDRRMTDNIATVRQHPTMRFADMATRRRASLGWHDHNVERLALELPDNFMGTSNVALARKYGLKLIGSVAHEPDMVFTALADARGVALRSAPPRVRREWYKLYGKDLAIALTDTFTTEAFLQDFSIEEAEMWPAMRHDSGANIPYGEKYLQFYKTADIDPRKKSVLFSNALKFKDAAEIEEHFLGRMATTYGIGGTIGNDLPVPSLNQVMKQTAVFDLKLGSGAGTVKLSNDPGKHTGSDENVARYQREFGIHVAA